jgi:chemotaxis protein methyltransferase CheR
MLATARQGEYSADEVKNLPLKYIENCFTRQGGTYRVVERIRARVDFSTYDLLDERSICPPASIFGDFDLILCCNLFLYYRPAIRRAILTKIHRCLAPRGYLATGDTERALIEETGGFRSIAAPAAVFRKISLP